MSWRIPVVVALALFVAVSCDQQPVEPAAEHVAEAASPLFSSQGVVHRVSLGGADACTALGLQPGCDANFSFVAIEMADGTVRGQWSDQFGGGTGLHVAIDCLNVVGSGAVVSGFVTQATGDIDGSEGQYAVTAVVDNGTSMNDDPDQMSFSFFPVEIDCTVLTPANFPLFDLYEGQVRVW
jgi:hypothetical protein